MKNKIILLIFLAITTFGQIPPDSLIHVVTDDSLIHVGDPSVINIRESITHFHSIKPDSKTEDSLVASFNMVLSNNQVLTDISGSGNNGTAVNVDQTIDGLRFDGVSSEVNVADIPNTGKHFGVNMKLKYDYVNEGSAVYDHGSIISGEGGTKIYLTSTATINAIIADDVSRVITAFPTSSINKLVSTITLTGTLGDSACLYLDGVLHGVVDLTSLTGNFIGGELNIASAGGSGYLKSEYYDFSYYTKRLTEQNAVDYYNESIKTILTEQFTYTDLTEMSRNWSTVSGVFTLSSDTLTATTGGSLTTAISLPYVESGIVTYSLYDGSWNDVSETVDASSVFTFSNNTLTMTLATNERIRNIAIRSGLEL